MSYEKDTRNTDNMRERMARELHKWWGTRGGWDFARPSARQISYDMADAVLRVMREPTIDMEIAGTEAWMCEGVMEERAAPCWRHMVDAALTTPSQVEA